MWGRLEVSDRAIEPIHCKIVDISLINDFFVNLKFGLAKWTTGFLNKWQKCIHMHRASHIPKTKGGVCNLVKKGFFVWKGESEKVFTHIFSCIRYPDSLFD